MTDIFQCPGEPQPISRSVHLGRLAGFYPACRTCPHRDETGTLSRKQVSQLTAVRYRAPQDDLFDAEGISGVADVEIDATVARRFAMALGGVLPDARPTIVLAGDARPLTAGLVAAAAEGLRRAGCDVVDIGGATSAVLAIGITQIGADGGLLIGNAAARPLTVSLKAYGAAGQPWSSGQGLDPLRERMSCNLGRGSRRSGSIRRMNVEAEYLAMLRDDFHALRPLRVGLDSANLPLRRYLQELSVHVAVEFVARDDVAAADCDFSIAVDGDGEGCRVEDERRRVVDGARLFTLFGRYLAKTTSDAVVQSENRTRRATFDLMRETSASLAGGASGRFWFAGPTPTCDALRTISTLLTLLSESDRPLSERLAGDKMTV